MGTYALLHSLVVLIGTTTRLAFHAISTWVSRKCEEVVHATTAGKNFTVDEDADASTGPKIFIPDVLARWPYPRRMNMHSAEVERESAAWMDSFHAFSPKAQYAFNRCNFSRLGGLGYPTAKREHVRASCDLMSLYFLIDEYTDVAKPPEVQKQKDVIMDALRDPHRPRPKGEWIGGEVARQFWERTIRDASKQSQKRFIETFDEYLEAVVQRAIDRSEHRIRNIQSYMDIRRGTVGVKTVIAFLELSCDIPDEVISHPTIQEMALASIDMIILANDIVSYNLEQSRGHDSHNIIMIVMDECGTDTNGAMLWVQDLHTKLEQRFHAAMAALPEWEEPLDSQVKGYCHGIGNLVRANYEWSFEGERYLGTKGLEIKEKRWVSLMPKMGESSSAAEIGPVLVDSSLL